MNNREYKFRAWDKEKKTMYMFNGVGFCAEYNCLTFDCDGVDRLYDRSEKIEIMQYTGLKDKNRKEIYERDIVKIFCGQEGGSGNYEFNTIEYEGDGFKCKPSYEDLHSATLNNFLEVIGNIYENEELISTKIMKKEIIKEFNEKCDVMEMDSEDVRSYAELFLKFTLSRIEKNAEDYLTKILWTEKDKEYFLNALFK